MMQSIQRGTTQVMIAMGMLLGCVPMVQADAVTDKLQEQLQHRLGSQVNITRIARTPIAGLYEVTLGDTVLYSDANGDYLLSGDLVDTKTKTNLTQARRDVLNKIEFSTLPLDHAVTRIKGSGQRKLAVFADPNCGYCKQLEATLDGIDNVTVYTFLIPILTPDSEVKAKSIWCSTDRAAVWGAWMSKHIAPTAAGSCDTTAIRDNVALGRQLKVNATPTLFAADGRRLVGLASAAQLEVLLSPANE